MEFATSKGEEILKDEQVSKQLHLISSETQTQTLNKKAVLNRIRNHKCIHKIKSLLHTTAANNGATVDADYYRWIDSGDVFSCPWQRFWHVYVTCVCDFLFSLVFKFKLCYM